MGSLETEPRFAQGPGPGSGMMQPQQHPQQQELQQQQRSSRGATPANKRKLDDRDLGPDELEHHEIRPPPGELNGSHSLSERLSQQASVSPVMSRRKRVRYKATPIWGQSGRGCPLKSVNFSLQKRGPQVNGKHEGTGSVSAKVERSTSRHTSPETARSVVGGPVAPPSAVDTPKAETTLNPWEPTIIGKQPYEELSKAVADFIYINVINHHDLAQIRSHNALIEVEAKLGNLVNKNTNDRVHYPILSECLLQDSSRVMFKSSMTEVSFRSLCFPLLVTPQLTSFLFFARLSTKV